VDAPRQAALRWHDAAAAQRARAAQLQHDRANLGSRVGLGVLADAAENERRAFALDPTLTDAALQLMGDAAALRDSTWLRRAQVALRRSARGALGDDPALLLARGRLERRVGAPDSARALFERYLASAADSALGFLELARTALAEGWPEGESLYYAGAALDDSTAATGYVADLAVVADPVTMARLTALRPAERTAALRRFWAERDAIDLRAPGERLREHYRRLARARAEFALTTNRRHFAWRDAARTGSDELDDRGVVYVRHGEPTERLRPLLLNAMPNETWRYARPDGDLVLHFSAGGGTSSGFNEGGDLYDYRLVGSVYDIRGDGMSTDDLLLSRAEIDPVFARLRNAGPYTQRWVAREERALSTGSLIVATTTDSDVLHFARPLAAVVDLIGIGVGRGEAGGQFVFALRPMPAEMVRIRVVAIGADDRPVSAAIDTTIRYGAAASRQGDWLIGHIPLKLPAESRRYRVAVSLPGDGDSTGVVTALADVPAAPRQDAPALSDLALATTRSGIPWVPAPGDTVYLSPFGAFRAPVELEVYYELSSAVPGAAYRHEITVVRRREDQREKGRPAVSLAFNESAQGPTVRARRALSLARLRPGDYSIRVRVQDTVGGPSVDRVRLFRIVK
jgi:GWxTD domain-containing protein